MFSVNSPQGNVVNTLLCKVTLTENILAIIKYIHFLNFFKMRKKIYVFYWVQQQNFPIARLNFEPLYFRND